MVICGTGRPRPQFRSRLARSSALGSAWSGRAVTNLGQLTKMGDPGVRDDLESVIDRRRDGGAALRGDEMHGEHAAVLRTVHIDVEVVADEHHLAVLHAERRAQRLEDGAPRLALAVLVGEDHGVNLRGEAEAIEDLPQRIAGRAAGVADEANAIAALFQRRDDVVRAVDDRRQVLHRGHGVDVLELRDGVVVRVDPRDLQEVLDLAAARDVLVARPVQLLAAVPHVAVRGLDGGWRGAEDGGYVLEAEALLSFGSLFRVGDEGFPEVEGDGFQHGWQLAVGSWQSLSQLPTANCQPSTH